MTKRDIISKLQSDKKLLELLIDSKYASDAKVRLEGKVEYVSALLEFITQEGKV